MESLSYGEFSSGLHQHLVSLRTPLEGAIEVTRRCPLNCLHCYNNLPVDDLQARLDELSYEEHCRILDEITAAGCLWLLYTGGEVFVRKDFLDIYTYAKKKGLLITLFTNGTLITPDVADYLAQWVPFSIEMSLYGRTRETHDHLTRSPGSYDRCMRGIRLLRERRLPLKIKTMALTTNKHEIGEMKRFVESDLGLEFRFDCMVNPRLDSSRGPLSVRLEPHEAVALDLCDPARVAEWRNFASRFTGSGRTSSGEGELYQCGGGLNSFAISPSGAMTLCVLDQGDAYDLRRGNFADGWGNHLLEVRRKKVTRKTRCQSCEIQAMCGMCPANGILEEEDPQIPVDFLCQVAHLRSRALDIPVPPHGACAYCEGEGGSEEFLQPAADVAQGFWNEGSALETQRIRQGETGGTHGC